uniref:Tubulin/FtsZ GTPase domain-containing protein n=1 Tax=Photinus pyralis TaxID=7054 RepID=A0A1Y1NIM8_PHOPY
MTEFITIQVGQCGNQIGSTFWPAVLDEYGFQAGKTTRKRPTSTNFESSFHSFFSVPSNNKCGDFNTLADLVGANVKARSILVDMEDSVVSKFKTGPFRSLFDEKCIVSNYPGSGNNWAEGYCYHGPLYRERLLNVIQKAVDKCDSLQGFILLFSMGGGTGSGLGTYILTLLADYFPHVERFVSCVYPTGTEDVITCPYNMALATRHLIESATCVFPIENRALFDIVTQTLYRQSSIVEFRPFFDMNNLVTNMLLHLTSGSRFSGSMNVDINEINTNMVPFPNLHFLSSSFSPLTKPASKLPPQRTSQQVKYEMFRNSCSRSNQLIKIDPLGANSVLLGSTLIGRGDFSLSDMRNYVDHLQTKGRFTHWSRKAVKVGLCDVPPISQTSAILTLFNTTAMRTLFSYILHLYNKLYQKKAHVHHYTKIAGFDVGFFSECEDSLLNNIGLYTDMENARQPN